jgi:hypothetical protein
MISLSKQREKRGSWKMGSDELGSDYIGWLFIGVRTRLQKLPAGEATLLMAIPTDDEIVHVSMNEGRVISIFSDLLHLYMVRLAPNGI